MNAGYPLPFGPGAAVLSAPGRFAFTRTRLTSKLLLIDDDLRLTDMVGGYLRHNGFEVETAGSLAAGRDRLKQGNYDALLLDLMLPDGDGLD